MTVSMTDVDPAFDGVGQTPGLEIWRIENFKPVRVPSESHGKFYTGDSYIVLKSTGVKSGALRHEIHYWLGKNTSQDEAGTAAIKTVELDDSLGGRAVQYREIQGHETDKFLSYFKPCIMPLEGGVSSGFKHHEAEEYKPRLYICQGKRVVHVNEVPFELSSLNHGDVFILDTENKIFQFNGSTSCIQERAKALEVVQYIKDNYHRGKCDIASVEDGEMTEEDGAGEFWNFFGGFAPLPETTRDGDNNAADLGSPKLFCVVNGQPTPEVTESLTRELLDTHKCYILDCGLEVFLWIGRSTSVEERKSTTETAEEMLKSHNRQNSHIIRVMEGSETVLFISKFDSWPQHAKVEGSEAGRGKVSAIRERGIDIEELIKSTPEEDDEPEVYIDCTGNLQVWRVNENEKSLLPSTEQPKFSSGDCYIFQYSYPGEDKEEHLIGTWFGKKSVQEERESAITMASEMVESMKSQPTQARFYEGRESVQFFAIFKGGVSEGSKKHIANENEPHLFSCELSKGELKLAEIYNFAQDDLMTEDVFILDCHSDIFVWVGQQVDSNTKKQALSIGEKFVERDFLREKLSSEVPIYVITEGNEPPFFTRFFKWDSAKSDLQENSFQRKLALLTKWATN